MAKITQSISEAKEILEQDALCAIPTETVYGLAGNALKSEVVAKIFEAKKRPVFDPLICHVGSMEQMAPLVKEIPPKAKLLMEKFWPGPLTLLLPKTEKVPDLVTAGSPLVGIRMPSHPLTKSLLEQLEFPLAAPSANPFGYISPTTAVHVETQLGAEIAGILDGGSCDVGIESTIVGFEGEETVIYRSGGIAKEQIQGVVGKVKMGSTLSHPDLPQKAPGMLESHYAPNLPLYFGKAEDLLPKLKGKRVGVLSFKKVIVGVPREQQEILSIQGDIVEATQKLFGIMRKMDGRKDIDVILAQKFPEFGLGVAINDRLRRASKNH